MCIRDRWASVVILLGLSVTLPTLGADALEPSPASQTISPSESDPLRPKNNRRKPKRKPKGFKQNTQSQVKQPPKSPKKSPLDVFLDVIFGPFPRKGNTQRTTKGGVCPLAPGLLEAEDKIFSDRPLFMWQGNIDSIEVRDYLPGEIIQSARIAPGATSWRYPDSLQPGEVYVWTLKQGQNALVTKEFQVMSQQEREQVIQHKTLNRRPSPLDSNNLSDAIYFSQHQLWSDTLTSLHEESDESGALIIKEKMFALGDRLCNQDTTAETARESLP